MDSFNAWPLSKQYLAAHYYLSEEKPISISEAQRAQLGALHLYISLGKYTSELKVPEILLCSPVEKKKRLEEWKKLESLTKQNAMQKFIDLLTSLFPNWYKSRKLLYEFQVEWNFIQKPETYSTKNYQKKIPVVQRSTGKTLVDSITSLYSQQNHIENIKFPKKIQKFQKKIKKSRFSRTQSIDIPNSLYSFKEDQSTIPEFQKSIVSDTFQRYKQEMKDANHLKKFIEDLQSYKGGNIKDTSAAKFPSPSKVIDYPDSIPITNFEKDLKTYRRTLLQQEFDRYKIPPVNNSLSTGLKQIQDSLNSMKLILYEQN
jgi:hypothetical protein